MNIARPGKKSGLDTIRYEITLLRYCAMRIPIDWEQELLGVVMLEAFLLHYRNIIRFMSGLHHRREDISTSKPEEWAGRALSPAEAESIQQTAEAIDIEWFDLISKYLQHCTNRRHSVPQTWDVEKMLTQLNPVLGAFERAFPPTPQ